MLQNFVCLIAYGFCVHSCNRTQAFLDFGSFQGMEFFNTNQVLRQQEAFTLQFSLVFSISTMETPTLESLSKEELIYYQEIFSIVDKYDTGCIPTTHFPTFVRGLGHCPTENEIKEMKAMLDPNNEGTIPFANIISLLLKRPKEQNIEEQLMEAFEAIQSLTAPLSEGEKNYKWSVREAKKALMDHGEMMSESQAEKFQEFLEEYNLKEGNDFNYHDLSKIMAYSYQN